MAGRDPGLSARLDHLVVAAASLESGTATLERFLGVALSPGGQHSRMGTHNRLLRLGADTYLELIAIDPSAPPPDRPRWLGLDEQRMRAALREGPRLIHWVAGVPSTTSRPLAEDLGPWEALQRGAFSWSLTVRADGALPFDGIVPSLIAWDGPEHPSQRLPDVGCILDGLRLAHPRSEEVNAALRAVGASARCERAPVPQMIAEIRTPGGLRVLRSTEAVGG
jgi:hypothetical protein